LFFPEEIHSKSLLFERPFSRNSGSVIFMNHYHVENEGNIQDNYESLSPIYLKETEGSLIVLENNTFQGNVGLFGGAVHIDMSPHILEYRSWNKLL